MILETSSSSTASVILAIQKPATVLLLQEVLTFRHCSLIHLSKPAVALLYTQIHKANLKEPENQAVCSTSSAVNNTTAIELRHSKRGFAGTQTVQA